MGTKGRFSSWALRKLAFALLLGGLGLAGVGLWLFLHDPADFAQQRQAAVRALTGEASRLRAAAADVDARMAVTRTEIAARQERAAQAGKVASDLEAFSGGLNRLTTSSVQLRENDERLARMRQMEVDSHKRVGELEQNLVRTQWEKDGMEIALERTQQQLATAAASRSEVVHYAREAWTFGGKAVLAAVAVVMIGPLFWRRRRAKLGDAAVRDAGRDR